MFQHLESLFKGGKHHYLVFALLIGAGVILYLFWRNAASSGQSVVTTGSQTPANVQEAEVNAAAQLQLAQQQSAQVIQQQNFQMAYGAQQSAADFTTAKLNADTSTTQQVNAITGQQNLATISATLSGQSIAAQEHIAQAQIDANVTLEGLHDSASIDEQKINAAMAVQINQAQTGANITIAGLNTDLQKTLAQTQAGVAIAQTQAQLGAVQAETGAIVQIAGIQAGAQKTTSWTGLLGTVATAALAFL